MACQTVKVKGSLLPFTILELQNLNYESFQSELQALTQQMPGFFGGAPVVIGLDKLANFEGFNAQCLFDICQLLKLKPMAFRGLENQQSLVEAQGYLFLNQSSNRKLEDSSAAVALEDVQPPAQSPSVVVEPEPEPESQQAEVSPSPEVQVISRPGKLITQPVRSGQQVYAPGGDLIIMGNVSEAAEVMADGHIHVYGTLRGRALAGVNGDLSARIFCHKLEAQLVSVAGYFKLTEDYEENKALWRQGVQARLKGETLLLEAMPS